MSQSARGVDAAAINIAPMIIIVDRRLSLAGSNRIDSVLLILIVLQSSDFHYEVQSIAYIYICIIYYYKIIIHSIINKHCF